MLVCLSFCISSWIWPKPPAKCLFQRCRSIGCFTELIWKIFRSEDCKYLSLNSPANPLATNERSIQTEMRMLCTQSVLRLTLSMQNFLCAHNTTQRSSFLTTTTSSQLLYRKSRPAATKVALVWFGIAFQEFK